MLAVPVSLFGASWVFFDACGFEIPDKIGDEYLQTIPAPHIRGFWIDPTRVLMVTAFKGTARGPVCTLLVLPGRHEVIVIGKPEEIMKRLRDE